MKIEHLKQTDRYIRGELTLKEIDQLWIEFLKDRELFEDFIIYLGLLKILHQKK